MTNRYIEASKIRIVAALSFLTIVGAATMGILLPRSALDACLDKFEIAMSVPFFVGSMSLLVFGFVAVCFRAWARWPLLVGVLLIWGHGIYSSAAGGKNPLLTALELAEPVLLGSLFTLLFLFGKYEKEGPPEQVDSVEVTSPAD